MQLEVVSCPSNELALTNLAFVSSEDLSQFKDGPDQKNGFVELSGFVLKVQYPPRSTDFLFDKHIYSFFLLNSSHIP